MLAFVSLNELIHHNILQFKNNEHVVDIENKILKR